MTQETYDKADELQYKIQRINQLIEYINGDANESYSDTIFLVNLLGKEEVLGFLKTARKVSETLFEQL